MTSAAWTGSAEGASTSPTSPRTISVLVVAATAVAWWLVRAGPYRLDDFATPLDDPASASLAAFVEHLPKTLRPLTKLTYALEAFFGVEGAATRRGVTALIHALGAGALSLFLVRIGTPRRVAALLALAWALHPIHAESVLSVAGRSAAVGATLVLVSLALLAHDRPRAAGVALALAVLGREAAAGASIGVFAFAVFWPGMKGTRLDRFGPLFIGLFAAVTWAALRPRALQLAEYSFMGRPLSTSIVQQVSALPVGLSLYLRPWALSADHGEALPKSALSLLFVVGALLIAAVPALAFRLRKRSPIVAVGLLLWLGALLPTQSFFPKLDPLTERPLGLALAGLVVAAGPLLGRATTRSGRALALGAALAVASLGLRFTWLRGALYATDLALWSDAASKSVANPRPFEELAFALDAEGRRDEAIAALKRARDLDPFSSSVQARLRVWERPSPVVENAR